MQSMLEPIVQDLQRYESGLSFHTRSKGTKSARIFLILSCNDKPAQELVQNLGEAHGRFGCGTCIIEGLSNLQRLDRSRDGPIWFNGRGDIADFLEVYCGESVLTILKDTFSLRMLATAGRVISLEYNGDEWTTD